MLKTDVDPYELMRNPATLAAYREHRRAVRAAAQPWITFVPILTAALVAMFVYALSHEGFRRFHMFPMMAVLIGFIGLASGVAGLWSATYNRTHPFRLPKA